MVFRQFRLLPILIFAAMIVLGVRVVDIGKFAFIEEQGQTSPLKSAMAQEGAAIPTGPDEQGTDGIDDGMESTNLLEGMLSEENLDDEESDIFDINELSHTEIRLLYDLANRRKIMIKQEESLIEREGLLKVAENQLIKKQQQLEAIREQIQALLEQYENAQNEDMKQLRVIYQNMKPKSAAKIFNDMDLETLMDLLRGMPARKVAPIVAAMNPQKARDLTKELSTVETLPDIE